MSNSLSVALGQNSRAQNVRLKVGNGQSQGMRSYQEDSCGFSELFDKNTTQYKGVLAVLADGMGGLADGKAVSTMVTNSVLADFKALKGAPEGGRMLASICARANEAACLQFCPDGTIAAGSTLIAAHIMPDVLHWSCIGDSRLYVKRDDKMYQVNEDHDYLNDLLEQVIDGQLSLADAENSPQAQRLTSCIGNKALPHIDYSLRGGFHLLDGDTVVICSDGVYNALQIDEFAYLVEGEPSTAAERVVAAVTAKGYEHQDNLTVMIIRYN